MFVSCLGVSGNAIDIFFCLVEFQNVSFNFLILEETNVYKIITIFIYRISFYKQISLSLFILILLCTIYIYIFVLKSIYIFRLIH